jgi:hypothetical protein
VHWLALLLLGVCAACTGPNPAYQSYWFDSDAADARFASERPADNRSPDRGTAADGGADASRAGDGPTPNVRLLGYWKFDEEPGATTAADSSGNGNHGLLEALDHDQVWVSGRSGNAIQFPATPDLASGVRIPLTSALAELERFTIAAWIYRTASLPTQNTSILSRQLSDEFWEIYNLSTINDELVVYAGTDVTPAPNVRVRGAAPVGVWMHVAATYDGATLNLYRDGQLLGTSPLTRALPIGSNPLYIGTNKNPTRNDVYIGLLDEVVLYSVPLSAGGISSLYGGTDPATL